VASRFSTKITTMLRTKKSACCSATREEDELLNGTGASGELNGLINNATTFNRGSTNLSALDAVALGIAQLIGSEYEPSGIVLSPSDWWSTKFMLAKNSQGEYLLGNPGSMVEPRLWGLPVVVTNSMTAGSFLVLDAARAGYIADREDAIVWVQILPGAPVTQKKRACRHASPFSFAEAQ
jgi:HK97 family phage major capsid protein